MRLYRCDLAGLGLQADEAELTAKELVAYFEDASLLRPRDSDETLLGSKFKPKECICASRDQALNLHRASLVLRVYERYLAD
jgi:hypothetical protein